MRVKSNHCYYKGHLVLNWHINCKASLQRLPKFKTLETWKLGINGYQFNKSKMLSFGIPVCNFLLLLPLRNHYMLRRLALRTSKFTFFILTWVLVNIYIYDLILCCNIYDPILSLPSCSVEWLLSYWSILWAGDTIKQNLSYNKNANVANLINEIQFIWKYLSQDKLLSVKWMLA